MRRKPRYKTRKAITHMDTHTKLASVYINVTHICIYIYIYMYSYVYIHIHIHIRIRIRIRICICICRVIGFSIFTCASSTAAEEVEKEEKDRLQDPPQYIHIVWEFHIVPGIIRGIYFNIINICHIKNSCIPIHCVIKIIPNNKS